MDVADIPVMIIVGHVEGRRAARGSDVAARGGGSAVCMKKGVSSATASRASKSQKKFKKNGKISYEPRRNFLQPQIFKNLLRKWSRFCKNIL